MSQYRNLTARRITADVYEASAGDRTKSLKGLAEAVKNSGEDSVGQDYLSVRGSLWIERWAATKLEKPTSEVEDCDMDLSAYEKPTKEKSKDTQPTA